MLKVEVLDFSDDLENYEALLARIRASGHRLVFVVDERSDRGLLIGPDDAASHAEAARIAVAVEKLGE